MSGKKMIIGIVAPGRAITPQDADKVTDLARTLYPSDSVTLRFHPQCFLQAGHFAGDDETRSAAFTEYANDPAISAIWFARGGYGSCRLKDTAFTALNEHAAEKTYLGYSDTGIILARLYAAGFNHIAHGPMPSDINRQDGRKAVTRALAYLAERAGDTLDLCLADIEKAAAFNITVLSHLIGTPWQPDLSGHVLLLEDVGEYIYRIDRALFTILSNENIRSCAGVRLGRCSNIPENDIDFGYDEVEVTKFWCARYGAPYLGRADIGHDIDNKIVPFGPR